MGFFGNLFGDRGTRTAPANKVWIMGTAPWGGVLFESGPKEMLLVLLPIVDRAPLANVNVPRGMVKAIIVCNGNDEGHLAASAIARQAGLSHVYAIDPSRPIDRGANRVVKPVEVRRLNRIELTQLRVEERKGAVYGKWENGITFLAGDALSLAQIADTAPTYVVGKAFSDGVDSDNWMNAIGSIQRVLLVANAPGIDAMKLANTLSKLGLSSEIVNQPAGSVNQPREPRRLEVLAHMIHGDLDRADALAVEAIAAGDEVIDMHHQRAMIALMRGDEAAADIELAKIDTPQALTSRAVIAAKRGAPEARSMIQQALDRLPGDVIAIRGAIQVHAIADDRAGARALLAAHGHHLDAETRTRLEHALEADTLKLGGHRFPEHAKLAFDAVKPMIDEGNYDVAEPLMRRAHAWDPENLEITTDFGFVLSKLKRDVEAIELYTEAIARGDVLLHFNRGNCFIRREEFAEAAEDFRACVEAKADWHDARVNLVSALHAANNAKAAQVELAQLKQLGGPPAYIRALDQMLEGTL